MNESITGIPRTVRIINIAGQKFGRLTAIKYSHSRGKRTYWVCSCECGKEITANSAYLKSGDKKSCGCLHSHGLGVPVKSMREHRIWKGMINRCYRKKNADYGRYGGRGIMVCDAWLESFANFYRDMGKCPDGFTIERKKNEEHYTPDNCIWASTKTQSRNKRSNIFVEIGGETKCVAEWLEHFGLKKSTYTTRVQSGWDRIKALTTPPKSTAGADWVVVEVKEG